MANGLPPPGPIGRLDRWAMWLSAACVVHCLATTFLVVALSTAGGLLGSPLVHEIGLVLAIGLGASGLSLMASALVVSHGAHHLMESALTIVGVSVLALAHLFNRQEPA